MEMASLKYGIHAMDLMCTYTYMSYLRWRSNLHYFSQNTLACPLIISHMPEWFKDSIKDWIPIKKQYKTVHSAKYVSDQLLFPGQRILDESP